MRRSAASPLRPDRRGVRLRHNPISASLGTTSGVLASVGGMPIKVGDEVIGGVGVSGAPGGHNDEACAVAGLAKVADQLR